MLPRNDFHNHSHRIFDTLQYGSERAVSNSFVLDPGKRMGQKCYG